MEAADNLHLSRAVPGETQKTATQEFPHACFPLETQPAASPCRGEPRPWSVLRVPEVEVVGTSRQRRAESRNDVARCVLISSVVSAKDPSGGLFEELAMPLFDSLYNFAHWLAQNRDEAEDLVQETYVKALKGFSSFKPGTNFRAWIFRILRNTFLTSRTGLQASRTVPLELDEDEATVAVTVETPESILIGRDNAERVQAAIEALPLIFREALLLCDVEDMSYQEIAETLSVPIGTVMSRLSRARKALRQTLGEKVEEAKHG
jgi:RNA polymerase sigma-70 factor, ECF subfamily